MTAEHRKIVIDVDSHVEEPEEVEGDMPHAEAREGAKEELLARTDLSEALKWKILSDNGREFLGL